VQLSGGWNSRRDTGEKMNSLVSATTFYLDTFLYQSVSVTILS
jgi:hypothetical protein